MVGVISEFYRESCVMVYTPANWILVQGEGDLYDSD